jgi:flagellar biogenesis protein FliO
MRRSRRGGSSHSDFASSGEDSFVAVVVTKLTGALLFILLLTMVIMALLPKAVDLGQPEKNSESEADAGEKPVPLQIATPTTLPDAIAGRPYLVALAATGGRGPLHWSALAELPEWLSLDESTGRIGGTPPKQTDAPLPLQVEVSDGKGTASQPLQLTVLPGHVVPSTIAEAFRRLRFPSLASRAWLEQGVGFLVLWLVHLVGMNLLANLERGLLEETVITQSGEETQISINKRFATYRLLVRLATLSAMIGLAAWLVMWRASTIS